MKKMTIERKIIIVIALIAAVFVFSLLCDIINYAHATSYIKEGNYTKAAQKLEKADGYRDSEVLLKYCRIMEEYDSNDFKSIYHSYRQLDEIDDELNNSSLSEEFIKTTTEVKALYNNYNVLLFTN